MNTSNEKKSKRKLALRIFTGFAAPAVLLLGFALLSVIPFGPPCIFYKLSGLYCPGCGTGRAAMALAHGSISEAFGYNPLMLCLLPFVAYYLLKLYIAFVFGKDILPFFKLSASAGIAVLVSIVLFGILRNIPVFPFTLLAP